MAVGFVVGLDYKHTHLNPFKTFQQFKTHPSVRPTFEGDYSKVPIIRTGPIIRTVLIFLGTLQL